MTNFERILDVTYPADGKTYHNVKPVKVYYCPKCDRKLTGVKYD